MEVENMNSRADICETLNLKLISRPGSLELIEMGVLEVDSEFKNMVKSGDIMFRRVSSDETDQSGDSPSMKVLKHQEALDDVTARRLSLAAQQQRQLLHGQHPDVGILSEISEQESSGPRKVTVNSGPNQRSLVTGQVSRFKGLVFHNYCPASSRENQEAREQQQEKFIQIQESKKRNNQIKTSNISSQPQSTDPNRLSYPNKCSKCFRNPDKVSSLFELTVTQLKTECRLRNLPRSGNKQALINTLDQFKDEILAIENACQHVTSHSTYSNENDSSLKPHLTDRSISLPNDYLPDAVQEPTGSHVPPMTLNLTCLGGSFSHLPFTAYPIVMNNQQKKENADENISSKHKNVMFSSSDIQTQTSDIMDLNNITNISHHLVMSTDSVCYSVPTGITSQNSVSFQSLNPLLIYKLPTMSDQEPAFIQTSGLEMIQIVQQELLRNIEYQSQILSDQEAEIGHFTLQRQRSVLVTFLYQLIQKTSAFYTCTPLINEQQKICNLLHIYPSFEDIGMSQDSSHNNQPSSQSFLVYLNQQDSSMNQGSQDVLEHCGENDLLNLINEVVSEDQIMTQTQNTNRFQSPEYSSNVLRENQGNLQNDFKSPNSPMQVDFQALNVSSKMAQQNPNELTKGVDQKRAAWLQRVSPRFFKATTGLTNSDVSFPAFNFDFPNAGSHTSSDGCCSINSSMTDPQILSPATEKVLFETIFQHTNSNSSAENDMFSCTMNMDEGCLNYREKSGDSEGWVNF